jgi:hypothetical protein
MRSPASASAPRGVGRRVVGRLLLVAAVVLGFGAIGVLPARADGRLCYAEEVPGISGGVSYHVRCVQTWNGSPGGGGGGGGGPVEDTCHLKEALETQAKMPPGVTRYAMWCEGPTLCQLHDPPTEATPEEIARYGKLQPPASVVETFCFNPVIPDPGGYVLAIGGVQTPRQLLARADEAYGNLRPPPAVPQTSPGTPSVVQLDTWFWLPVAEFDPAVPVRGSSADGMVALATPQSTTWDPGDGTETIQCAGAGIPYAAGAASTCTHIYRKASFSPQPTRDPKGNPAYLATVTRTYVLRYEFFGIPVVVPGARLQFAVQTQFPVAVQEVQAENN